MIKHSKVSAIPDEADTTVVRPSDWNADHVIDDGTITLAKLANISATKRVLGRNTAGAGVPEEVSASQLFDWVSSANGSMLARFGGSWGAITNIGSDGANLVVTPSALAAPAAGKLTQGAALVAGRTLPSALGASGGRMVAQPMIAHEGVATWQPAGASTTMTTLGTSTPSTTGTATGRNPAATNLLTSSRRIGYVSAAVAASASGVRTGGAQYWLGNAAGLGGFYFVIRFAISDAVLVATGRTFAGLMASVAAPTDVDPSTLVNLIGVGNNNGDTNLQLYASGAVAQARVDLGVNFPAQTTNVDYYELVLYATPNATQVGWQLTRLNTGNVTSGTVVAGASLFSNTTFVTPQLWRANGGAATAVGVDLGSMYIETDN